MVTQAVSGRVSDRGSGIVSGIGGLVARTRASVLTATALLLLPLVLGSVVGAAGLGTADAAAVPTVDGARLLGHNLLIAALCASGLVTLGLGTLIVTIPSWFVVGTQVGASLAARGVEPTARGLLGHAVLELAGFALAVAVGLAPLAHVAGRIAPRGGTGASSGPRPGHRWRERLGDTAWLALASVALLALAAVAETTVTPALLTG